ncbi:hypothetical protein [Marinobacter sp. ST-43]|uniref:hypothetical protein n=1 Tax=Marinobacter sp. ST-43 TaxID=3050453 RepID=UPI0026DF6FD9|nr:hypothetical protein [Marinobacter sp. ST-43]
MIILRGRNRRAFGNLVRLVPVHDHLQRGILFSFEDYLELVDCTGRISRSNKRGCIDENALPILERLNLDPERWCHRATAFEGSYQDYRNPGRRRQAA